MVLFASCFSFGFFLVYAAEYGIGFPAVQAALWDVHPAEAVHAAFLWGRNALREVVGANSPLDIIPPEWVLRPYSGQ